MHPIVYSFDLYLPSKFQNALLLTVALFYEISITPGLAFATIVYPHLLCNCTRD
jgi:hypothetical protein